MEKYLQVNDTWQKLKNVSLHLISCKIDEDSSVTEQLSERNEKKKREGEKRVFGVHIWLVSSGREAQLVPKGIGQLLMEALGMSAARPPPIHGREKKTDRSIDSLREAEADEEDLQGRGTGSFLSSRASQPYRAARNECCESAFAASLNNGRRRACENVAKILYVWHGVAEGKYTARLSKRNFM